MDSDDKNEKYYKDYISVRSNFTAGFINGIIFSFSWGIFYGPLTLY